MENVCQSCGMFMSSNDYGKNADGSVNTEYCKYCFPNGKFGKDETMEEMIESCIPFWLNDDDCKTEEDARNKMMNIFPKLKRWKNSGGV